VTRWQLDVRILSDVKRCQLIGNVRERERQSCKRQLCTAERALWQVSEDADRVLAMVTCVNQLHKTQLETVPCRGCVARDTKGIGAGGTDAVHLSSRASQVRTQAARPPQPSTPVGR